MAKIKNGWWLYQCECIEAPKFLVLIGGESPSGKSRMTLGIPHKQNHITDHRSYTIKALQRMADRGFLLPLKKKDWKSHYKDIAMSSSIADLLEKSRQTP